MLMQTQLIDLKRVNQELQEENESYMILLREKTLSGQFDLMRQVGGASSTSDDGSDDEREGGTDGGSLLSLGRSTLDRVVEEGAEVSNSEVPENMSDSGAPQSLRSGRRSRRISSHLSRGESLADLPITGPGLDLAAELGRAENKDILAGNTIDDRDRPFPTTEGKHNKKKSTEKIPHSESAGIASSTSISDIDALRTEVKSLKDANKALSLYASKIIDRIIAQEGFEHVLAVDYDKEVPTPVTATPRPSFSKPPPPASKPKQRPQSVIIDRSASNPNPTLDKNLGSSNPQSSKSSTKAQRRSLSFDWRGFSLFNAEKKPEPSSQLRPLTLTPGAASVTARKLDNLEDEEDRRERERLHATMKLMGIHPTPPPSSVYPGPSLGLDRSTSLPSNAKTNRRFSVFGPSAETSDASSVHSTTSSSGRYDTRLGPSDLTQEALEHAEAENSLAVLDAHERDLGAEIAKGSNGGFTEITPRVGRKSRRSAGGSGSTVWSAGMSGTGEE